MSNSISILIRRRAFVVGLLAFLAFSPLAGAGDAAAFQRQEDIIYGRKDGVALTRDCLKTRNTRSKHPKSTIKRASPQIKTRHIANAEVVFLTVIRGR
jgi:hypothetical protein